MLSWFHVVFRYYIPHDVGHNYVPQAYYIPYDFHLFFGFHSSTYHKLLSGSHVVLKNQFPDNAETDIAICHGEITIVIVHSGLNQ
ncbi:hypothetical protein DPMN_077937, partial [Dreissena polymorpha]